MKREIPARRPDELQGLVSARRRELGCALVPPGRTAGRTQIGLEVPTPLRVRPAQRFERVPGPVELFSLLEQHEPEQSQRGLLRERIRVPNVFLDRGRDTRLQHVVDAGQELARRAGAEQLLEEGLQRGIVGTVEVVGRLAELGDPLAEPGAVLGVLPDVQRECTLHFPFGDGVQVRGQHEQRLMLDARESAQETHGFLHRAVGSSRLLV